MPATALADLRPLAAVVLAPIADTDPPVHEDIIDSVVPSALMLYWDDPWIEAGVNGRPTLGPCEYTARLRVRCVAGRTDPGSGVDELERLVAYVLGRMRADTYTWPLDSVSAPEQTDQGGIPSLVADVIYAVPTTV